MLYPFLFVTGAIASATGAILGIKEDNDKELAYEADRKAGYNSVIQNRYDYNTSLLFQAYDTEKMINDIQNDYPRMTHYAALKVASASIAKKLMEEETKYKYKPSEDTKYFNLSKYTKDEYRRKMTRR